MPERVHSTDLVAARQRLRRKSEEATRGPKITVPLHAHPLIHQLFSLIISRGLRLGDVSRVSGVAIRTMWDWREKSKKPSLPDVIAVANALGLELVLQPREEPAA